jgi:hypothetical protein
MTKSSETMDGEFVLVLSIISLTAAGLSGSVFDVIFVGFPVVIWPYMTVAEMPMPCCPLDWRMAWNREPKSKRPKTLGIMFGTMPGPLSSTVILYSFWSTLSSLTTISGR